jgi:hypothetical protein
MFLDDDEEDAATLTRKFFGETAYKGGANFLSKGILGGEGSDISSRVGLSNLILAHNRYNFNPSVEKDIVMKLGGPAYGYGSQILRGIADVYDGETQRGLENILPAAFRNLAKSAFRYGDEGALTRRGDPIMDNIGGRLILAQMLGFAPAEYTLNQERNQILKGIDRATNEKRTKLLRRYYTSSRMGDQDTFDDNLKAIDKFNEKWPTFRISPKSIKNSMKKHKETSREMFNGVVFSPKMRKELMNLSEEWDNEDGWL